jgi:ADP-glucose pyrophosphorylase
MSAANPLEKNLTSNTFALVLAGGNGTRLGALTRWQCKPAIPFAASFRNIDFTLSNCLNSDIRRIAVLTQYKAQTLITHLAAGWSFLAKPLGEFVEVWPAQQRLHKHWYAGTADAVYQNVDLVMAQRSRYTLVLAGDHIYKMDYLLVPRPPIDLYDPSWPVVTAAERLPPARLLFESGRQGCLANSLLGGGVVVHGAQVTNSVLSSNVLVADGSALDEAVVLPGARVGANCRLRRVIIDAGVEIPDGTVIGAGQRVTLLSHDSLGRGTIAGDGLLSVA